MNNKIKQVYALNSKEEENYNNIINIWKTVQKYFEALA